MPEDTVLIQNIRETQHFYACEEVQRRAWGMDDTSVVPAHLLITAQKNGGLVLGAFNEQGEMTGFLFGFLGAPESGAQDRRVAERVKHCSHMMGILPEYQGKGIGYLLKLRQREHVLSQGLELVTWTYDPLESLNANLNVRKLGVVCDTYLADVYGQLPFGLNVDLASDRFLVNWWVASRRVKERIEKGPKELSLEQVLEGGAKLVNAATVGSDGLLRPSGQDLSIQAKTVVVEVPADFQSIKATDMSLGVDWRRHTRDIFQNYFHAGYIMTEFVSEMREGLRHSYYVLQEDFAPS